jgi:uncharacterized protein YjbI with pentapeptide repeats
MSRNECPSTGTKRSKAESSKLHSDRAIIASGTRIFEELYDAARKRARRVGKRVLHYGADVLANRVAAWNEWRYKHRNVALDFAGTDLRFAYLTGADLSGADLSNANLCDASLAEADLTQTSFQGATVANANFIKAKLMGANLTGAVLSGSTLAGADLWTADLIQADLTRADLTQADLQDCNLTRAVLNRSQLNDSVLARATLLDAKLNRVVAVGADFSYANLTRAELKHANLTGASLVETVLCGTNLTGSRIYGVSAWDVSLRGAIQKDLIITPKGSSTVTVDNLEVAQFLYLLLNNQKIRHVIDTITSKVVLILGRFTPQRKVILDAIRDDLRKRDYLPVLFDFQKPANRDITETVSTLAHMARFVIADITDAKSIPQELMAIVPTLPSVPVQPLLLASQREYGMFEHFKRFPWVLEPYLYENQDRLLAAINDRVIGPAEAKAKEQTGR